MAVEHHLDAFRKGLPKKTAETGLDLVPVSMGDEKFLAVEGSLEIPGFRCTMITVSRYLDKRRFCTSLDDAGIRHVIAEMDDVVNLASLVDGPDCERIVTVCV